MQTYRPRTLDPTKILARRELVAVLTDLNRKAPRSRSTRLNLVVFRLACCWGLRAGRCLLAEAGGSLLVRLADYREPHRRRE